MSAFEDASFSVEQFSGRARVFPLPNLVLFPHVMQPLHVFELRYRDLLEDALAGDRLIALATLAPGWERQYEGRPPLYPIACLGRITTYHRLKDGTYNVLLLGIRRVRLVRELAPTRAFREAEVEVCEDRYSSHKSIVWGGMQQRLRRAFLKVLPMLPEAQEQLDQLLDSGMSLGVLTDVISYMLDINLPDKEALLAQLDVHRRAELLLKHLWAAATATAGATAFPPGFSSN